MITKDTYQTGEYVYIDTDFMAAKFRPGKHTAIGEVVEVVKQITDATGQTVTLTNFLYKILVVCDPFGRFATDSALRFADEMQLCLPQDLAAWQLLGPDSRVPWPANA